jgi:NADH dehydrogenase
MKSIADSVAIRDRVFRCLEQARWETDTPKRREILTFVVGGGGFTGVETMAALNDLARSSVRDYPGLSPQDITTIIIEPGERLLGEITPDLAQYAKDKLQQRGVRILFNTKITSAGPDFVEIEGGKRIPARTIVWAGGVTANPLVAKLDCAHGHHGTIMVDRFLSVPGHPGVWALGDCAQVPRPGSKGFYGPTAQNATREGAAVARNIVAAMRGENPEPFAFESIGEIALVGRRSGVASIYGYHLSGFPAWAAWRAIYLSKMPGMAQRSRILVDWVLDLVFGRNVSEIPIAPRPGNAEP